MNATEQLLEALAPLCAVVEDYATHPELGHEPHDRILGRIGRNGELPPYLTWGQICAIEDAAYTLGRQTGSEIFSSSQREAEPDASGDRKPPTR